MGSFHDNRVGHDPRGLHTMGSPPAFPRVLRQRAPRRHGQGASGKRASATAILLGPWLSCERSVLTRAVANRASGARRPRPWKEEGTPFLRRKRLVHARRRPFQVSESGRRPSALLRRQRVGRQSAKGQQRTGLRRTSPPLRLRSPRPPPLSETYCPRPSPPTEYGSLSETYCPRPSPPTEYGSFSETYCPRPSPPTEYGSLSETYCPRPSPPTEYGSGAPEFVIKVGWRSADFIFARGRGVQPLR